MNVRFSRSRALGRAVTAVIVIALLVVGGAAVYFYASSGPAKPSSSTTTGSSTITTSAHVVPQSITYETLSTVQFLDPNVSYDIYGASVEQNIYEPRPALLDR